MAQSVKHLPAMQETRVRFLCREEPLKKEMATYSSVLTWEIPWTKEPGGLGLHTGPGVVRVAQDFPTKPRPPQDGLNGLRKGEEGWTGWEVLRHA